MILVQAFPANQTLSEGIIRYLSDYFNVHFINLPGFHPSVPALEVINVETYTRYVERRIAELGLNTYILAGISFGFLVVNSMRIDKSKCLLVLGSGPFLGHDYVEFSKPQRLLAILLLKLVLGLRIEDSVWKPAIFKFTLSKLLGNKNNKITQTIQREVDPRAFFATGLELLKYRQAPRFQEQLPYVLLINPRDEILKFHKTLDAFWEGVETGLLRVILTAVPHYPADPSYEYFKKVFTKNEVESLLSFIGYVSRERFKMDGKPFDGFETVVQQQFSSQQQG